MSTIIADGPLPHPTGTDGGTRKVGVELEFGGVSAEQAAATVARVYDARAERVSAQQFDVRVEELGKFGVELDARWTHPEFVRGKIEDLPESWRDGLDVTIADLVASLAGTVMPVEIVAPPIAHDRLGRLQPLIRALAEAGAEGTKHSNVQGFGMHLNVEVASTAPDYLLSVLRAYVLLAAALRREARLDPIRQLQSYIDPFSVAYARHILRPAYAPDTETLIRDHIGFHPTRNMELDMLPVFSDIAPGLVAELLPEEKNSPRPAFHWRLPDCRIDEPGWDFLDDWRRWISVERLAADKALLDEEAERFLLGGPQSEIEARLGRLRDALG
ncbi:MAG: amidoligase family protein [Pseudomonadota bacterium]